MATHCLSSTLTVWAWDNNFNVPIMEEAASRYLPQNPQATIKVVEKSKQEIELDLWDQLIKGNLKDLPDIVLLEDYRAPKYLSSFPNHFVPLSQYVNHNDFATYKNKLMTLDGHTFGMPFDSGVTGLYFRADIFSSMGIRSDAFDSITWDEFIDLGIRLKEEKNIYMMSSTPLESGLIRLMLQSTGEWFHDDSGKPFLSKNSALIDTLEIIRRLYDADILLQTNSWDDWVASFTSGNVASLVSGVWITGTLRSNTEQAGKWMVAPIPRINRVGAVNASNLGGSSWYVLNKPNHQLSADFLNAIFAKDQQFYQKILRKYGAVGTYLPSQQGKAYTKDYTFFVYQQIYELFSRWMTQVPAVNYGNNTYDLNARIASAFFDSESYKKDLDIETMLFMIEREFLSDASTNPL